MHVLRELARRYPSFLSPSSLATMTSTPRDTLTPLRLLPLPPPVPSPHSHRGNVSLCAREEVREGRRAKRGVKRGRERSPVRACVRACLSRVCVR